ncbi:hypothetical protein [Actinoplanes sp. NPDC048796]|uniref:hypothetical protein n=1 Tax=Actinoplanes sp. NPDC048796 TaxID=3155640 RepID=UPI0033EA8D44
MLTRPDLAFAISVTEYDHPGAAALPRGRDEVDRVFAALESGGFTVDPDHLTGRVDRESVLAYLAQADRKARRVVLYWTGHGVSDESGSWLFTSGTDPADPAGTGALDPAAIASALGRLVGAGQVVMILDCCGSGDAALDIASEIVTRRSPDVGDHESLPAISLISATYGSAEAQPMLFASALADALTKGPPSMVWPAQRREVTPQDLADAASAWLRSNRATRLQRARAAGVHAGSGFFANPLYDLGARDVLIGGDLFVRRTAVLDRIEAWSRRAGHGLFLLTGSIGTGKSTVVDQLAADGAWTKMSLSKLDLRTATVDLARRLQLIGERDDILPEQLVERYAAAGGGNLAFDSLDEADPENRLEIARRLLLPLAALPGGRILVSRRSGAGTADGAGELADLRAGATGDADLDDDATAEQDIRRLATRILEARPLSPYRGKSDLARRVGEVIAARTGGIFFVATHVAIHLTRAPRALEPEDPDLARILTEGIGGVVAKDFQDRGVDADRLLDLLTPLAWAAGRGVPVRGAWPAMVDALRPSPGSPSAEADITAALAEMDEFVTATAAGGGERRYRLRHLAIADYLRSRSGRTDEEANKAIVRALKPAAGGWPATSWYVRDHLVEHADRAGVVPDLLDDPDFMVFSEPRRTLVAVTRAERGDAVKAGFDLYLRAGPRLADNSLAMRVFLLESLRREGTRADAPEGPSFSVAAPCRTRWTTARAPSRHRLIRTGPDDPDMFAAVRTSAGGRIAVTTRHPGSPDSGIEIWDPTFTVPPRVLRGRAGKEVTALTAAPRDERDDMLVVAYGGGNFLEGRLLDGDRVIWTHEEVQAHALSCVWAGGSWAVAATDLSRVRLFRASDGSPLGTIGGEGGNPKGVLGFRTGGVDVLCYVTDNALTFWGADRLDRLGVVRLDQPWSAAAIVTHDATPVIVGARADSRLELRAAATGRQLAVAPDRLNTIADHIVPVGSAVAVAAADEISVWGTRPLERVHRYTGHADRVNGLGVVRDGTDRSYITSAARDGTVRVWSDSRSTHWSKWDSEPPIGYFERVHSASVDGRPVILVEDVLSWVLLDEDDGSFVTRFDKKRARSRMAGMQSDLDRFDVWAIARARTDSLAIAGQHQGVQEMWSVTDRADYGLPTPGSPSDHGCRVLVHTPEGPMLVTGDGGNPIGVFRLTGGRLCTLQAPPGARARLTVTTGATDLVLVENPDGTLAVHDPIDGLVRIRLPLGETSATPLAAVADLGQGTAAALVATGELGVQWLDAQGRRRPVADRGYRQRATVVRVADGHFLVLADRDRVLLIRPADGSIATAIPFVGPVNDVISPAPGRLCLIASARVVLVELADTLR